MKKYFVSAFLIAGATISSAASNLVVNGSFETADFTGWTLSGDTSFSGVTGILGASDGSFAAFFGSVGSNTGLTQTQTLNTAAGHHYTFSFDLKSDGGTPNFFSAAFNSNSLITLTDQAAGGFIHYSFDVVAASSSSNISFELRDDPGFLALDNVVVVDNGAVNAAPAPAALASFGLGLAARLRRRKKA